MFDTKLTAITVEKGDNSTVTIEGEILYSDLERHKDAALQKLGESISIDGFRKGHIPPNVLIERVGEMALISEMAERALAKIYPAIVTENKLDVIGYPQISITKIAKDNPLGFKAVVAIVPEVTLPDYTKIARAKNKDRESEEVTDEELEEQIKDILRQKVAYERLQDKAAKNAENKTGSKDMEGATELPTPETVEKSAEKDEPITDPKDIPLPELTDEYVKGLGQPGQFESVDDFKSKVREHLTIEKKQQVAQKHRAAITDMIVEQSEMELPDVLVEAELGQMTAQMEEDLKRAQLTVEDYLSHMKKTKDEMTAEWRPAAEKRAKLQLVLNAIAKKETITPNSGEVDHQVDHLMEQYKDADKARVRTYVESVMTNEAVMKMLEEVS